MKPWTDLQEVGDGDHRRLLVRRHFVAAHRKLLHERGVVVDEMACGCCWEQLHGGFSAGRWIDRSCGCRGSGLVGCCNKGAAPWSAPRHRCAHPAARGARCGPSHSRGAQLALHYHGAASKALSGLQSCATSITAYLRCGSLSVAWRSPVNLT